MCYAPSRRVVTFTKVAKQRISEGKLPEAERLLNGAIQQGGSVMNVRWTDGRRVGEHIEEVRQALLLAKRGVQGS